MMLPGGAGRGDARRARAETPRTPDAPSAARRSSPAWSSATSAERRDRGARTAAARPRGTPHDCVRRRRGGRVRRRRHPPARERSERRQRARTRSRGAVDAVARVRASGRPILFFTNGTGRPPAEAAADLRALGFALDDDEYMNPAVVAARWIERKHPGRVRARARRARRHRAAARAGHRGDRRRRASRRRRRARRLGRQRSRYSALRAACDSVWAGAPLLATSTASVFSVNGGRAPGWSGAVVAGIRQTTGAPGGDARQAVADRAA